MGKTVKRQKSRFEYDDYYNDYEDVRKEKKHRKRQNKYYSDDLDEDYV